MSATPPRCSRCSGSASRSGRSTPCSSRTTPATAPGRAACSTAPTIDELVEGIAERGVLAHCDGVLSGYMGSADIGAAILARRRPRARGQPAARSIAAIRSSATSAAASSCGRASRSSCATRRCRRPTSSRRTSSSSISSPACDRHACAEAKEAVAAVQRARAAGRAGDLARHRRDAGRRDRPPRRRGRRVLAGAHAAARPQRQRRRRRHRGPVPGALCPHRLGGDGARRGRRLGLRPPRRTAEAGSREILLVAAQDEFVSPTQRFAVERV